MKQRRTGRKTKANLKRRLRSWKGWWRQTLKLGSVHAEGLGFFFLLLAALTAFGLSDISSGTVLNWWAGIIRRWFGWGAYPVLLGLGGAGLRLMWSDLRDWAPIGPEAIVGLELLLLVALTASHAPWVLQSGADEALSIAQAGQAGGYVGWTVAMFLFNGLGVAPAWGVLSLLVGAALYLLGLPWWGTLRTWGSRQVRLWTGRMDRWWVERQGTVVTPAPPQVPWWEQEPTLTPPRVQVRPQPVEKKRPKRRPKDENLPPLELLNPASSQATGDTDVRRKVQVIERTLESFGIPVQVVEVNQGPTVTQFGLAPGYIERRGPGGQMVRQRVRVAQIAGLVNDLALALAASPIRIEAPVPGRSVVGLEVPNEAISLVSLREVIESEEFRRIDSRLAIALGEDVSGRPVAVDLALMPHLLIAGATGSGKSVCINAIICCLLCNNPPEALKMLMVDPKMVELVGYNGIPHLLAPVVVDVEQIVQALAWVTHQMDERYRLFHKSGARNLEEYNRQVGRRRSEDPLPILVVFIDELADVMMVAPDEVERYLCRLAQMGRATGIHLVVATQRPSVDVVTGLIKANFPARISFAMTSQIDSRVILDQGGAENLLGRGDMLFLSPQQVAPIRLQGCLVSDQEIERLVQFWREKKDAAVQSELFPPWTGFETEDETDRLLSQAIQLVERRDRVSTSFIQRQLRIGFPRAARLMDQLEEKGIVGPDEGAGRGRKVIGKYSMDQE